MTNPRSKSPDDARLYLSNGRLTPAFWVLKEGLIQGFRPRFQRSSGCYDWYTKRLVSSLQDAGYLESKCSGPRGGLQYHTTGEGAVAMLMAEAAAAAHHRERFENGKEARAKRNERRRQRLADAKVQAARRAEQETCAPEDALP